MKSRQFTFRKRYRSHENLESLVISRDKGYPIQGQYYVNIDILQCRGAISLDENGWARVISDIIVDNDDGEKTNKRKSTDRRKGVHSYVREYYITNATTGQTRDRVDFATPMSPVGERATTKAANISSISAHLLHSFRMFKHRFKEPKERVKELTPKPGEFKANPQCQVNIKPQKQSCAQSDSGLPFTKSHNDHYTSGHYFGKEVSRNNFEARHQPTLSLTSDNGNQSSERKSRSRSNCIRAMKESDIQSPKDRQSANISRKSSRFYIREGRQNTDGTPVPGPFKSPDIVESHHSSQQRIPIETTGSNETHSDSFKANGDPSERFQNEKLQNAKAGSNDGKNVKGYRNSSLRRQPVIKGPSTAKQQRSQSTGSKPVNILPMQPYSVYASTANFALNDGTTKPVIMHRPCGVEQLQKRAIKQIPIVQASPPTYEVAINGRNESLPRKWKVGNGRSGNNQHPIDYIDSMKQNMGSNLSVKKNSLHNCPMGDPPPYQRPSACGPTNQKQPGHVVGDNGPHCLCGQPADRTDSKRSSGQLATNTRLHNQPISNHSHSGDMSGMGTNGSRDQFNAQDGKRVVWEILV